MALETLECPSCGARLEASDSSTLKCPYCGSVIHQTDDSASSRVRGEGTAAARAEELFARAQSFVDIGNPERAQELFEEYTDTYPGDFKGWDALIAYYSLWDTRWDSCFRAMEKLADEPAERTRVEQEAVRYNNKQAWIQQHKALESQRDTCLQQAQALSSGMLGANMSCSTMGCSFVAIFLICFIASYWVIQETEIAGVIALIIAIIPVVVIAAMDGSRKSKATTLRNQAQQLSAQIQDLEAHRPN